MPESTTNSLTPQRRLLRLLGQFRREIRYIILYAVVAGAINLSLPLGIQAIIGQIAGGGINALLGRTGDFCPGRRRADGHLAHHATFGDGIHAAPHFYGISGGVAVRIPRLNLELLRMEYLPELVNRFLIQLQFKKVCQNC
ncbi:MAG: hypothetical protein IPH31_25045 [Lewinellaceae bacterium]|nr:hypothetical protein [Lewinellaceae bacterium]